MLMIVIAALILAGGSVVYFEKSLRRNVFLQSPQSSPGPRDVSSEAERKAQPESVNPPAPDEVARISSASPRGETGQNQS